MPFTNSTLVISAWENERLIGAVRVLSDRMFRSIIYDLLVLPEFQNKGIGKELLKRCFEHFPNSEWLVQTTEKISSYYEKRGFKVNNDVFLTIPCKLFSHT
ncbi:GNAT family N-acetyltransferase [Syntrophaceticus schinkii]|uniref:GNAT family N-acetyltransferase n=1 Tax=Syntrophaceticus schinkii TaxID=499207 RepID=UPI0009FF8821|nr:GNAT family N-acetyltransferase [Syntrophaceticus schinkii]